MASEPRTAEERVEIQGKAKDWAIYLDGRPMSRTITVMAARVVADALIAALQSMHDDTREATVRECCAAVRKRCPVPSCKKGKRVCAECESVMRHIYEETAVAKRLGLEYHVNQYGAVLVLDRKADTRKHPPVHPLGEMEYVFETKCYGVRFEPATDPAAALWALKMLQRQYPGMVAIIRLICKDWRCRLYLVPGTSKALEGNGKEQHEAICAAILEAGG